MSSFGSILLAAASRTLFRDVLEAGTVRTLGFLAMPVGLILAVAALTCWVNRRGPTALLFAAGIAFFVGGYVVFGGVHFSLNLQMRNPQGIREECAELLRTYGPPPEHQSWVEVPDDKVPPSIRRLNPTQILVRRQSVLICLRLESTGWQAMEGYAYVQPHADAAEFEYMRPTWYRDLFHFYFPEG
jgi:hypothetical protein